MTFGGPQPRRWPRINAAVAAILIVGLLVPILPASALAGPVAAATLAPAASSPWTSSAAPGGLIHGAGSDEGLLVTPSGVVERTALMAVSGPASCTGWTSETLPPSQIRVYRTRTMTVETVDFRAYVRKVVTGEFARDWAFQLLAIGAITAKQNAWYWAMRGRDWTNLRNWAGVPNPITKVAMPDGRYQWQTTDASPSGPGQCWDLTDNPAIDQCYDCQATPTDPSTAPRNQAALDATWGITIRRPRSGVQSFFAPGYAGRLTSSCPSMATQADWETWFTGNIDFNQARACAALGESAEMLLRRFLSSALQIRDPGRADLTGDGRGDIPVLRVGLDAGGAPSYSLDPATADPAFAPGVGAPAPLGPDPGTTLCRAVGRLDRLDRASLVSLALDPASGMTTVTASSLAGPGAASGVAWWTGQVPDLDPRSTFGLSIADITGDMLPEVLLVERASVTDPTDPSRVGWRLRLRVLATTEAGADPSGFVTWADLGPFTTPTRLERVGDVDGDGRADLVFAPADGAPFVVARAMRDGSRALGPAEPYAGLVAPASAAEWRFFALADGSGTGRDEPVIGATGAAAQAAGGDAAPLALLTAAASSDPTNYAFTLGPLVRTWSGVDGELANGLSWVGDAGGDGLADFAVVSAIPAVTMQEGAAAPSAQLAVVGVGDGQPPASVPVLPPAAIEDLRVIAPGDQSALAPDASLSGLRINVGTLRPAYSPDVSTYTVVVSPAVTAIRIKATTTRSWARMTLNGKAAVSAVWAPAMPLAIGANPVRVAVADGPARAAYTITVVRASVPGPPTLTKAAPLGGGRLRLNWRAGTTGGSPITAWMVQYRRVPPPGKPTPAWTSVRLTTATPLATTLTGLRAGWTYEVRVIGRNIVGLGKGSLAVRVKIT